MQISFSIACRRVIGLFSLESFLMFDKSYYNYAVASASTYNAYNTYPLSEFNVMFKLTKDF